jgi:sugar phosphate isomerase/epimerase
LFLRATFFSNEEVGSTVIHFSYSVLPYGDEPLETSFERVARFGYDRIELLADPGTFEVATIKGLQERFSLPVGSVCMIYTPETDLVSSNPDVRANAVSYIREMIGRAGEIGVQYMPITPTACMKIAPEVGLEEEWKWAREGIRGVGEYAAEHGIKLVIEPWNRYETYLINRLDQAVEMAREVDLPNVGVKGDLFHMNIEERSLAEAIRGARGLLWHVDFADSTRAAPSVGHIDFDAVMAAIKEIEFEGIINFELLPAAGDPFASIRGGNADEFKDEYTELALRNVKAAAERAGLLEAAR